MLTVFPKFTPLSKVQPSEVKKIIENYEPYSDFNYVSLFSWNTDDSTKLATLNGNLIISLKNYLDDKHNLMIIGDNEIDKSLDDMFVYGNRLSPPIKVVEMVPEVVVKNIKYLSNYKIDEDFDNNDYVLLSSEALNLDGKKYTNKRKNINRFKREYEARIEKVVLNLEDPHITELIKDLCTKWDKQKTKSANNVGSLLKETDETIAIKRLLHNISFLKKYFDIYAVGILIGGALGAFCIYEKLENQWSISHFGKADNTYKNMYEYLMNEVLIDVSNKGCTLLNYEQDLGIVGIRESKMSCKPIKFLSKYTVYSNK